MGLDLKKILSGHNLYWFLFVFFFIQIVIKDINKLVFIVVSIACIYYYNIGGFSKSNSNNMTNTPNLPTSIIPTNIARLKLSGKSPMGLGISPLTFKIVLESNPLKSTMLVGRLAVNQALLVTSVPSLLFGHDQASFPDVTTSQNVTT